MFTPRFLDAYRRKAIRKKVWYNTLDDVERKIMFLTSRVVDVVKSERLGREIVKILAKLRDALKSGFVKHVESYGLGVARIMAGHAVSFGNVLAKGWSREFEFARYFAFMDLNKPSGWGL